MQWHELDSFTRAYVECALWASKDDNGEPLDGGRDASDVSPDTLADMAEDCRQFRADNAELLDQAGDDEQNGHDFWLTRERHGAGYWDRGYGDVGRKLTDAAHVWGDYHLYVGDDGQIHH